MTLRYNVKPYVKHLGQLGPKAKAALAGRASSGPWSLPDLCAAYSLPKASMPGGGVIGIVELGGGWVQSDINAFFSSIGQPVPSITDVSVDGTKNTPTAGSDSPDYEVALDIMVSAAVYYYCTGKAADLRIYWAQDIATAVAAAQKDAVDTISISWGADEANWGSAGCIAMDNAAAASVAAGIPVFAAAGDNDASDGGSTPANVDCPASCPHVVGCGGTSKSTTAEVVWDNDANPTDPDGEGTGGGFSTVFPVQLWQVGAPTPPSGLGRMVPDVAANADPNTGYIIYVHGSQTVLGGTSAVAPLYAGLFASFGRKLGNVLAKIWANQGDFTDITTGTNGLYDALKGPDACTGVGVPIGSALAGLFAQASPSPAPPAPSPPPPSPPAPAPPAPPGSPPTAAQITAAVQAAVAQAFGPHFVLFRSQATSLANAAIAEAVATLFPNG